MSIYRTNGFLVSLLEQASRNVTDPDHAEAQTYLNFFRALETSFFASKHPYVDLGLAMSELTRSDGTAPNLYTVHGCQHIFDLIKSLDKLAEEATSTPGTPISPLEAYILLSAAHVHDAQNVVKRKDHADRCYVVIQDHKDLFVPAATQQIYDVARVHGGSHPEYDKDTFRSIEVDGIGPPRLLLLAAMLRLGDELSENEERVPKNVANGHRISDASKLAHAYAKSFSRFELREGSLFLVYSVYPEQHELVVTIKGERMSFYDFLEDKLDEIELETRYCSQYARPDLSIFKIEVTIRRFAAKRPSGAVNSEKFTLHLNHGYPKSAQPLCQRSPQLKAKGFHRLNECFLEKSATVREKRPWWAAWRRSK